ncbi:hypothetical protein [Rubripirellula reticaptiva]|uniref:Uncharacterized protein n=1 Tax=Rubripirellula reticaptiva TaxID=2528013 RepID=A0A5C6ENK5_9BACT|nr:hypothetical protein [Rubripirellula reticaptiva]TWU49191.1 hypothetical protein Poly59_38050 [Rubripirellula reticaptiva]
MTQHQRTTADVMYMTIVALPLLALGGMFTASAIKWRSEKTKLQDTIEAVLGNRNAIDYTTLPRRYDEQTSDKSTATWKAVLSASEAHNSRFGGPFAWSHEDETYGDLVPPDQPWPVADVMARYAKDAQPILDQMQKLLGSDDTIWVPIIFQSTWTNLNEIQQTRSVSRLVHYSFLDAIHQGDNERAIRMLRLSNRLFGSHHDSVYLVDELVHIACRSIFLDDLRHSIAADVWTDAERKEIEPFVFNATNWDTEWRQMIESEMLSILPGMLQDDLNSMGMQDRSGVSNMPFRFAPSMMLKAFERQHGVATIRDAGTTRHRDRVEKTDRSKIDKDKQIEIDCWLQFPFLDSQWAEDMFTPAYVAVAEAIRRMANEERFTRTVFSLREYHSKLGEWPESLDKLADIGLPISAIKAFDGGPFHYEIKGKDAVIYAQANKDVRYVNNGEAAEPIVMIGK